MRAKETTTPDGERWVCTAPDEVQFLHQKIFSECEYGDLLEPIAPASTIVDVGANIGVFARWSSKKFPESKIIAFEPIPALYECLVQNSRPEDIKVQKAVGSVSNKAIQMEFLPEYTILSGRDASAGQAQYVQAAAPERLDLVEHAFANPQSFTCELTTLETALTDVDSIGLLKVDVEGMESEVFAGIGDSTWPKIQQIVAEVHVVGCRLQDLTSLFEARGFRCTVGSMAPPCFKLGEDAVCEPLNTCLVYAQRASWLPVN